MLGDFDEKHNSTLQAMSKNKRLNLPDGRRANIALWVRSNTNSGSRSASYHAVLRYQGFIMPNERKPPGYDAQLDAREAEFCGLELGI